MNIIDAAEILNIRHDADYLVVKAAYHALAKRHHPDRGGDAGVMQKVNAAHDYMSTRSQQARMTEWERLQPKPAPQRQSWHVGQFDDFVNAREAARKAASANPTPPMGSTTRPWKPARSRRVRFTAWKQQQPLLTRWLMNLSFFLLIMAGRLIVVAGMFYLYAEAVRWSIKALAHGAWVLLIIFPGIMVAFAGFMVTAILALNFLHGGWKGIGDYLTDRGHEGMMPDPTAWTQKKSRWL